MNLSDWNDLDDESKEDIINDYLSELSEQPTWMVDKFEEI